MNKEQGITLPMKRVHIELTNNCNFNCAFCPKSKMTRKRGFMSLEMAKRIMVELKERCIAEKVTFHIMGEPFMHPNFFDILSFAKKIGLRAGITTNGSFFTKSTVLRLSSLDIGQINISLQTPSEDTYALRQYKDADYNTYCQKILTLLNTFAKSNPYTTIKLHFLNTKFNKSVKETIGNIDIISDNNTLHSVFSKWVSYIYNLEGISNKKLESKVIRNLKKQTINKWNVLEVYPNIFFETYMLDSWGTGLRKKVNRKSRFGYCSALTDHFGILWNGDLILCCKDFNGNTKVANIEKRSIYSVLMSDALRNIYRGFKRYRLIHPYCQECLGGTTLLQAVIKQAGSIFFFDLLKNYFYNQKRMY